MEKNELLKIYQKWTDLDNQCKVPNLLLTLRIDRIKRQWKVIRQFWQLKAKMDFYEEQHFTMNLLLEAQNDEIEINKELIAEQKKQILGFAKDNALLHQRLKKCQEIIKEFKDAEVLDFDTPTWIIRKGFKEGEKRG